MRGCGSQIFVECILGTLFDCVLQGLFWVCYFVVELYSYLKRDIVLSSVVVPFLLWCVGKERKTLWYSRVQVTCVCVLS